MQQAFRIDAEKVVRALLARGFIRIGTCRNTNTVTLASVAIAGQQLTITFHVSCKHCGDWDEVVDVPFQGEIA